MIETKKTDPLIPPERKGDPVHGCNFSVKYFYFFKLFTYSGFSRLSGV